jgi:phospholipase C
MEGGMGIELEGIVERRRAARSSKSEHVAVVLRAPERPEGSARSERAARRRKAHAKPTARPAARAVAAAPDPFRHVVLLMLENRSFDHMLGALQGVMPGLDGVPPSGPPRINRDMAGVPFEQRLGAAKVVDPDPPHGTDSVLVQIAGDNGGFVSEYERAHRGRLSAAQKQEVMAYHEVDSLWALHQLGRTFAVCDGWFCSVPGPTWTNRLFAMSGTSQGRVKMPEGIFQPNLHRYDQPSVFLRLEQARPRRSLRIYFGDFPLSLLLADRRRVSSVRKYRDLEMFFDAAGRDVDDFPDFALIEPRYLNDPNDDHPPHSVDAGQELVARVYEAIRANAELWASTLLVVTYDEHGGFYDHRVPPPAVPPDDPPHAEYEFNRLGVRVPTVLISPWITPQVVHTICDHTALLRSLQVRWGLGAMGARVAAGPDVLAALSLAPVPRDDTPMRLERPAVSKKAAAARRRAKAPRAAAAQEPLTDHQRAIVAFSQYLDTQTPAPPTQKVRRMAKSMRSDADARQVAEARARRFLAARGARPRSR